MQRVLVLGGSGFVGRPLCSALAGAGAQVRVVTRLPGPVRPALAGVEWIDADVHDAQALAALLPGHDVVINLVAILHGRPQEFERVHVTLPQALAKACAGAGVAHLLHVSALGADEQGPSHYQRSKGRGEAALRHIAEQSGLALTLLRPSVIFGADDQFLNMFARIQRFAPLFPLAGAHTRFQPVWVYDVAQALLRLAQAPAQGVRVFEACGPEVFTLADLVRHAGRWARCPRPVLPLPLLLGRCQAALMELLPGKPLMSRDNVDSLRVDNVASGSQAGLRELGIEPTPLGSVFRLA